MTVRHASVHADTARTALSCLDLTSLNESDTVEDIDRLCDRALSVADGLALHPAAVCLYPRFVAQAVERLRGSGVAVATVVNFPEGTGTVDDVVAETRQAIADGAHEIDVVFPYTAFRGDLQPAGALVRAVVLECHAATPPVRVKAILETGELRSPEAIRRAAKVVVAQGVDFLKTSTGKTASGATLEAVDVMLSVIEQERQRRQRSVGIKVSGGVRTVDDALAYIKLAEAADLPGGVRPATFRIGASSLLDDIVKVLTA